MADPVSMIAMMAAELIISTAISFLFPAEGPRLKDLQVSTSTYGNPIPEVWGTCRVGGNMIWSSSIIEVQSEEKQGLSFYNQYTYKAHFAMALCKGPVKNLRRIWANGKLIYDATGTSNITSNGQFTFVWYPGDEDQLADPTMASFVGASETPAYRGTSYILFKNFFLTNYGNQIPQIAAEVYVGADSNNPVTLMTTDGTTLISDYVGTNLAVDWNSGYAYMYRGDTKSILQVRLSDGILNKIGTPVTIPLVNDPWDDGLLSAVYAVSPADGRILCSFGGNNNTCMGLVDPVSLSLSARVGSAYPYDSGCIPPPTNPGDIQNIDGFAIPYPSQALFDPSGTYFATVGLFGSVWFINVPFIGVQSEQWCPPNVVGGQIPNSVGGSANFGSNTTTRTICPWFDSNQQEDGWLMFWGGDSSGGSGPAELDGTLALSALYPAFNANGTSSLVLKVANPDITSTGFMPLGVVHDNPTNGAIVFFKNSLHTYAAKYSLDDLTLIWQTNLSGGFPQGAFNFQASEIIDGQIAWAVGNTPKLWVLSTSDGTFVNRAPNPNLYKDGNWLEQTDVEYHNPGNDGYTLPSDTGTGMQVYDGVSGSLVALSFGSGDACIIHTSQFTADTVTLDEILIDLMTQAGLLPDDYDFSAVSNIVIRGYGFAQQTDIKGIIGELQNIFLFDMIERDRQLVVVMRGGSTAVETISANVLGSSGGDKSDFWKETRISEADLPEQVTLKYMNVDQDFQQGTAISKQIVAPVPTVFSRQQDTVEASIAFTPTEAKDRVYAMLYVLWAERTKHSTKFPPALSYLEPSDLITVVMTDGRNYFERITRTELGADFSSQLETKGQDSGAYTFNLTGDGGDGGGQTLQIPVPARPFILNVPYLRDIDNGGDGRFSIFYDAVGNLTPSGFNGATLMMSPDGANYTPIGVFTRGDEWGMISGVVPRPTRGYYALDWDTKITIWPAVTNFNLQSITDDELWAGGNPCIIGDEVIQFRDAVHNGDGSWTISNLLRGRRGTEWACDTHGVNEFFVFLEAATVSVGQQPLDAGGKTFFFKAVGTGRAISTAQTVSLTYEPRDLMPYRPVQLAATYSGADIVVSFERRTRYAGGLVDGTGIVPLNEKTEAYEMDVYSEDGTTILRTIKIDNGATPVDNPTITYTGTQVAEDFPTAAPVELTIELFQVGITGRGFGNKQTLLISGAATPEERYWGASALTTLTEAQVKALGGEDIAPNFDKSVTYNCSGGKYPYFCFPATYGTPSSVTVGGVPFNVFTVTTLSVNGISYNIIKFDDLQSGSAISVVWA